jgi:hypothetical protein
MGRLGNAVSEVEAALVEAQWSDYQCQVFAGPVFQDLPIWQITTDARVRLSLNQTRFGDGSGLATDSETRLPSGWTIGGDGLIVPPSDWSDVTDQVHAVGMTMSGEPFARMKYTLRGERYSESFSRNRSILVYYRTRYVDSGSWTSWCAWKFLFLGFVARTPHVEEYSELGEFACELGGVSHYMNSYRITPHHWGATNIAAGKSVTVSSNLSTPEILVGTGEFYGATATISGDNLTNSNVAGTPWISNDVPQSNSGLVLNTNGDGGDLAITEVYARPASSLDDDLYQWFEIYNFSGRTLDIAGMTFVTLDRNGVPRRFALRKSNADDQDWNDVVHLSLKSPAFGIFCFDKDRFSEKFSQGRASWVQEWRTLRHGNTFHLNPNKGYIGIYWGYYGPDEYHEPQYDDQGELIPDYSGTPAWDNYHMWNGIKDAVVWAKTGYYDAANSSWFRAAPSIVYSEDWLHPDGSPLWPPGVWEGDPFLVDAQADGQSMSKFVWQDEPGGVRVYFGAPRNKEAWNIEPYPDPGNYK